MPHDRSMNVPQLQGLGGMPPRPCPPKGGCVYLGVHSSLALGASHRYLLSGAALLGATLTMLADAVSRTLTAPAEIPVSLVTSALGAPFFLWLISRVRPR